MKEEDYDDDDDDEEEGMDGDQLDSGEEFPEQES